MLGMVLTKPEVHELRDLVLAREQGEPVQGTAEQGTSSGEVQRDSKKLVSRESSKPTKLQGEVVDVSDPPAIEGSTRGRSRRYAWPEKNGSREAPVSTCFSPVIYRHQPTVAWMGHLFFTCSLQAQARAYGPTEQRGPSIPRGVGCSLLRPNQIEFLDASVGLWEVFVVNLLIQPSHNPCHWRTGNNRSAPRHDL
jgi:hypothetical protein